MTYTQTRIQPWQEVMGADAEKLYGFGNALIGESINASHPAGFVQLTSPPVPAGKVWVICAIQAYDVNSPTTQIILGATESSQDIGLIEFNGLAANHGAYWNGMIPLGPGATVSGYFSGTLLNDPLHLRWIGYIMTLP